MIKNLFKIVVGIFCICWILKEVLMPVTAAAIYSREYMRLVVRCDGAMEAAWYGNTESEIEKKAQQIHLLDCHDYDKTRKVLLISGLPEIYLSWLGLHALEIYQRPASEMTEQHRFTVR